MPSTSGVPIAVVSVLVQAWVSDGAGVGAVEIDGGAVATVCRCAWLISPWS